MPSNMLLKVIYAVILNQYLVEAEPGKKVFNSNNKKTSHPHTHDYKYYQNPKYHSLGTYRILDGVDASDEGRLQQNILRNYSTAVRPVKKASSLTYVKIGLTIIQVMDLSEQNQVMTTNAQISLKWFDEYLVWNPNDYKNLTKTFFLPQDIWTPDIALFNNADEAFSSERDFYLIKVESNGSVSWVIPEILRSYCSLDIRYFPFDRQKCTLEFQSWSTGKDEIIVVNDFERPFYKHSHIQTEWNILNVSVVSNEENKFIWLEYTIHLKRNHAFYVNNIILPFTILSILTVFVFWLPPDSGEKITLTLTILLALTVFLQFIAEYTPKAAKSMPIIGLYFNVYLILVIISIVFTITVLNFHFPGPKKHNLPLWAKKYIILCIGKYIGFHKEIRIFKENEIKTKHCLKDRTILYSSRYFEHKKNNVDKTSNKELNNISYFDVIRSNDHNDVSLGHNLFYDESNLFEQATKETTLDGTSSQSIYKDKQYNTSDKLSRVLLKTLDSFKPFNLNDNKLKLTILEDILECQRLLMSVEIKKRKSDTTKIDDEWKVLAMIVDRICFFLYLSAVILTPVLFILKEFVFYN